ncbi:YraN family protein [Sphingobacterium sp. MYb382]|uniref:YraN family protein n=1 Tax=Sphingobacterium sp. MYb382 TaxID=2745278 RepID=UPI0030AA4458
MAQHLKDGEEGERRARLYLEGLNYQIIAVNWRHKHWEVDIIAQDADTLVFVEVKSRSSTHYGEPASFVDIKKQKHLIDAADAYLASTAYEGEIRFDIVAVYLDKPEAVQLIKDAFWSS